MERSGGKASREKRGRSERSKNTTEIEKRRAKREEKIVVRISEQRVKKVVRSRSYQAVYYRTRKSKEKICPEKAECTRR